METPQKNLKKKMITLLILIPIIGSIILLPMSNVRLGNGVVVDSSTQMKKIALSTSLINFFVSLFLWYNFDSNTTQFQFVSEFDYLTFGHLNFGVDGISLYFVLLTTFITPIAIISNAYNINSNLKFFLIAFLVL